MLMKKPLFLVMAGEGINCERETAAALRYAGAEARIVHINDLVGSHEMLATCEGMVIPGGFSFGDELGSGKILSLKILHQLKDSFLRFVESKKPLLGVCNGFQVLVQTGVLPFPDDDVRVTALAPNTHGGFINKWCDLQVLSSACKWTDGMQEKVIRLPIRHGEGRIVFSQGKEEDLFYRLQQGGQIPLTYADDVNGSYGRIAALCDPSGMILGMMPHPEAFVSQNTADRSMSVQTPYGLEIFKNIVRLLQGWEISDEPRKTAHG